MHKKPLTKLDWVLRGGLIVVLLIAGGVFTYVDSKAKAVVEAMYSKKIFDTDGFGVYALNDKGEMTRIWTFKESPPEIQEIPEDFVAQLLEIEDKRFYEHDGVDTKRVVGAAWYDIKYSVKRQSLELPQGASTLTQQFAREVHELTREKKFMRKLEEALIARRIEERELIDAKGDKKLAKKRILQKYCSYVDLGFRQGRKVRGFRAASLAYFGKQLEALPLADRAILIGMLKGITKYGPHTEEGQKGHCRERRNLMLDLWLAAGLIPEVKEKNTTKTPGQVVDEAKAAEIKVIEQNGRTNSFLVDETLRELEYLGRTGGSMKVYTTFDLALQEILDRAIRQQMPGIQTRYPGIELAAVVMDWRTGAVLAMTGGTQYGDGYNRMTNSQVRRQPGSGFKPFVYAAALADGFTAQGGVMDEPFKTNPDWPENTDGKYEGAISIEQAIVGSRNGAAVNIASRIGFQRVAEFASKAGLPGMPTVPAMALGVGGVRPIDFASAFTAFANKGKRVLPYTIESITNGQAYSHSKREMDSFSASVAEAMTGVLTKAARYGTGEFLYKDFKVTSTLAGKTGSSRDGWMTVYSPYGFLMSVYVGFDEPNSKEHKSTKSLFGASTAGLIIGGTVKGMENFSGNQKAKDRFKKLLGASSSAVPQPSPSPSQSPTATPEASPSITPTPAASPTASATPKPEGQATPAVAQPTPQPAARPTPQVQPKPTAEPTPQASPTGGATRKRCVNCPSPTPTP